jgi:TonB family protein
MRTLGKFLAPFALFVSLVLSLSAWGHKPKVKKGAFALVEKAYAVSNLQDSGLPPFKALVREVDNRRRDGSRESRYSWVWVSQEKWRFESSNGKSQLILVENGENRLWSKSVPANAHVVWLPELYPLAQDDLRIASPGLKAGKIRKKEIHGIFCRCVQLMEPNHLKREVCLNAADHTLVRSKEYGTTTYYSDYRDFQGKKVPFTVRQFRNGKLLHVFQLLELSPLPSPDFSLFAPPAGATEQPGCADPIHPAVIGILRPVFPSTVHSRITGSVKVQFTVEPSGSTSHITIVDSDDPLLDQMALNTVTNSRFMPATCHGTPVPYHLSIQFSFR